MNDEQQNQSPDENQYRDAEHRSDTEPGGGPLDSPPQAFGEGRPSMLDRMQARQAGLYGSKVSHSEQHDPELEYRDGENVVDRIEKEDVVVRSHESIMQRRWRKFKSLKRGYYSFLLLVALYIISFLLPLLVNNKPLMVSYNDETYFPAFADLIGDPYYSWEMFGREGDESFVNFRELKEEWEASGETENSMVMPLYPWDPYESDYDGGVPPNEPSSRHILGTDDIGRDVIARMAYGFNISISFGLGLTIVTFLVGSIFGALMGYFGGWFDLLFQRGIEIWQTLPALYVIIIVSSIVIPNFTVLILLLAAFGWIGMTYYMRGEFYREKAKDYVAAAISLGTSDTKIIFRHILPNSLTPLIATFPFAVVAGITALVSLDFLGYVLPPPTPSWGQMLNVGMKEFSGSFQNWWLIIVPVSAMFFTLLMVTFIGEAIREAFDPKVFSRLR